MVPTTAGFFSGQTSYSPEGAELDSRHVRGPPAWSHHPRMGTSHPFQWLLPASPSLASGQGRSAWEKGPERGVGSKAKSTASSL